MRRLTGLPPLRAPAVRGVLTRGGSSGAAQHPLPRMNLLRLRELDAQLRPQFPKAQGDSDPPGLAAFRRLLTMAELILADGSEPTPPASARSVPQARVAAPRRSRRGAAVRSDARREGATVRQTPTTSRSRP